MPSRPRLSWLAALLVAAAPLVAQADDLAKVRGEYGEVETARIAAVIEAGERDGLPRSLLVAKAVEGAAKRMEPEVVRLALVGFADELRMAATVVGRDADPVELEKTADALRHGVDRDVLADLHRAHPETFAVMVVAIEDLLHAGVTLDTAQELVREAASRGFDGDQVLGLPATVRRLVREGRTPTQAASSVHQGLLRRSVVPPPFPNERFRGLPGRAGPPIPPPAASRIPMLG